MWAYTESEGTMKGLQKTRWAPRVPRTALLVGQGGSQGVR